jgi:glutathione synthase/RimK-type ligase-like ATP-grasp enzyme
VLYTQALDEGMLQALDDIGPEPYLFQALVTKAADVRVTVVGDKAYACRIGSQQVSGAEVDWRAGELRDLSHSAVTLPSDVDNRCVELARSFGLRFAAIDLAETVEGGYVFFEVNPNGQWAWVEQMTGQPLRTALADELAGGRR